MASEADPPLPQTKSVLPDFSPRQMVWMAWLMAESSFLSAVAFSVSADLVRYFDIEVVTRLCFQFPNNRALFIIPKRVPAIDGLKVA